MHGFLQAVEATAGRLAIQGECLRHRRLGDNRPAQQGLDPEGQSVLEGLDVQGDQDLADPSHLRGPASETESVPQLDVLVLRPLTEGRETPGAAPEGATH